MTAARAVLLSLLSVPAANASAQEVSLASVLERGAAYVSNYRRQLSGIVAEEQYTQDERLAPTATVGIPQQRTTATHRELKSDFLLVPAPGADGLVEFRDVFEVDGKPVRDRENRLARLFLQRSPAADDQIRNIVVNRCANENDAVTQKPRINIVGALASVGLFNNHRDQGHVFLAILGKCHM